MESLNTEPSASVFCAWCAAPLTSPARRLAGRRLCAACGAATTDPWPTDEQLSAAYESWYRPAGGRFPGPLDRLLRRSRGSLARRIDLIAPPGTVLDVGAGDGALLDALREAGRPAVGLERESARSDVREQELEELDERFAAIVFWHSLEHLRRPGSAIDHAASLLEPGGVLLVAIPNAASLQARAFGDRWLALDLPRHLVHLPAAALLERLDHAGLRVERVSHWRGGQVLFGWLHGLVGSLPGHVDLYDAIRRPQARRQPLHSGRRARALGAGVLLAPLAALAAAFEVTTRRGGSIYVEARRV